MCSLCWGENILLCSYSLGGTACFWPWFSKCVCLYHCTVPAWEVPLNSIWVSHLVSTELEGKVKISQMNWSKLWKPGLSTRVQQFPMSCALPSNWAATGQLSSSLKMCHFLSRKPLAETWNKGQKTEERAKKKKCREMRSKWQDESEGWLGGSALALRNFKSLANKETSGWDFGENIKLGGSTLYAIFLSRTVVCKRHSHRMANFTRVIQTSVP